MDAAACLTVDLGALVMVRKLRPEERELWKKVADTATPISSAALAATSNLVLPGQKKTHPLPTQSKITAFQVGAKSQFRPVTTYMDPVSKAHLKMDAKSFGKLTRGKLNPEARLDLHGMTTSEAHPILKNFILSSAQLQRRLVLVITGKGKFKPDRGPIPERHGILRHSVPLWLLQSHLASVILEVTPAHQRHGGSGALYVYLRRRR